MTRTLLSAPTRPRKNHLAAFVLLAAMLRHRLGRTLLALALIFFVAGAAEAHTYELKVFSDTSQHGNVTVRNVQVGFGNSPLVWDCMSGSGNNCVLNTGQRTFPPRSSTTFSSSNAFSEDFKMKLQVHCGNGSWAWVQSGLMSKNDKSRMVILHECDGSATWGDQASTHSGWLDRDNPGAPGDGNHDWEKQNQHLGSLPSIYDGLEPAFVEMRLRSNQQDVFDVGDDVTLSTRYGGKVKNYSGNPAAGDYEILFRWGWTPWLNEDRDNTGDEDEGLGNIEGIQAPHHDPIYAECRPAHDRSQVIDTDQIANGWISRNWGPGGSRVDIWISTDRGCICYEPNSSGNPCDVDLEARYYYGFEKKICNGNADDGMDNGRCDATAGQAKLVAKWNGSYCLDVSGVDSTSNNTNVQLWSCSGVSERWRFDLETGQIHAAWDPSMCLDVAGTNATANGTNVGIYDCDHVTEKWTYDTATGHLRAKWNSNVCLDISGVDSTTNGKNAQIWSCSGVSETWNIVYE